VGATAPLRSLVNSVRLPKLQGYTGLMSVCDNVSRVVCTEEKKVLESGQVVGEQAEVFCVAGRKLALAHNKRHPWRTLTGFTSGRSHEHRCIGIVLPFSISFTHRIQCLEIRSV